MLEGESSTFDSILKVLGINPESLAIRLGRGVLGRVSYVAALAMVALAVVAYKSTDKLVQVVVIAAIAMLFLIYFFGILRFSIKHRDIALLEGAELLAWRQMDIHAKTVPIPPQQTVLADPGTKAISGPGDDPA
jgi:hypothetical protein